MTVKEALEKLAKDVEECIAEAESDAEKKAYRAIAARIRAQAARL